MQVCNPVNGSRSDSQQQMPAQGTEGKATPRIRVISFIRCSTVRSCEVSAAAANEDMIYLILNLSSKIVLVNCA